MKIHYVEPIKWRRQWTVCGLFRGYYLTTAKPSDVTCKHCIKWLMKEEK